MAILKANQVTFGTRSLRSYGPKTWNARPYQVKILEKLNSFNVIIRFWKGQLLQLNSLQRYNFKTIDCHKNKAIFFLIKFVAV